MKRAYYPLFIVVAAALSSCFSSMKIRVDALNMPAFKATYLHNAEKISIRENNIQYLISPDYQKQFDEYVNTVVKFIDTSGHVADNDTAGLIRQIKDKYKATFSQLKIAGQKLLESGKILYVSGDEKSVKTYEADYSDFKASLTELENLKKYFKQINEDISVTAEDEVGRLFSNNITVAIDNAVSAFGESIAKDPMASVIAALPEQYWSKYDKDVNLSLDAGDINQQSLGDIRKYVTKSPNRYNFTRARTLFGNSDIAIKMVTPGEFIVKGVRVDADEAIRNSFKVVSQGIKYLAYSSGVPVIESPNAPKKSITPLLDSITQKANEYQSVKTRYAAATEAFLTTLSNAADDLNATTARPGTTLTKMREGALDRIKKAYSVYKAALSNN